MPDFLMERFSNVCNSYTKTYNNLFKRKGALFIDYLKRYEVTDKNSLINLINYIHFNAVDFAKRHGTGNGARSIHSWKRKGQKSSGEKR
jgi:hypothetical protein